jgi:hypothetical protein
VKYIRPTSTTERASSQIVSHHSLSRFNPGESRLLIAHALIVAILNLGITAGIVHVFRTPRYAVVGAMQSLLPWALGINLASSALLLVARCYRGWVYSASWVFILLDSSTSILPLALIRCLRIPAAGTRTHLFGLLYALFMFSKCFLLVQYAHANANGQASRNFVRVWVFATSLLVYAGITPWVGLIAGPNGDEPAYLLLTHSLFVDHDINVENNYARSDFKSFFPPDLPGSEAGYPFAARKHDTLIAIGEQHHTILTPRGEELLWHDIGMPLLLVPGYALGGRLGVMLELNLITSLMAVGLYEITLELGATTGASVATWALFAFTSPLLVYSSQVFPEIVGATCVVWAVTAFIKFLRIQWYSFLVAAGSLLALLPWLCVRYWMLLGPLTAVIALYILVRSLGFRSKRLAVLFCPILISIGLFSWLDFRHFGTLAPNAGYIREVSQQPQFRPRPDLGLLGLFLDRAHGLLPIAPVYILAFAGAGMAWKRNRLLAAALILPSTTYILFMAFSQFWFAGWSPVGRYVVAGVVLWVPLASLALMHGARPLINALALWSFAVGIMHTAFPLTRYPSIRDMSRGALAEFFRDSLGCDFAKIFPSLMRANPIDLALAVLWTAAALTCVWFLIRSRRQLFT